MPDQAGFMTEQEATNMTNEMRSNMIETLEKVLHRLARFDSALYREIAEDDESYDKVAAGLGAMIERLKNADNDAFLHAPEAVENRERRRLEEFGI